MKRDELIGMVVSMITGQQTELLQVSKASVFCLHNLFKGRRVELGLRISRQLVYTNISEKIKFSPLGFYCIAVSV